MADFCKQCTDRIFGADSPNDMSGITTPEAWDEGKADVVICEGCGPIQVNPVGECVSIGCLENHNTPEHHIEWKQS